jgi:hypothetical protein
VFGDIVVTYERMQEVEFSFFTLPDSGAFLTHAPRRLSEAFALIYPFQMEVWPALICTIIFSGPILYLMIIVPEWFNDRGNKRRHDAKRQMMPPKSFHDIIYIKEMAQSTRRKKREPQEGTVNRSGLFCRCIWFTCHIFLRQCS